MPHYLPDSPLKAVDLRTAATPGFAVPGRRQEPGTDLTDRYSHHLKSSLSWNPAPVFAQFFYRARPGWDDGD